MDLRWYLRRLSRMGPAEIAERVATVVRIRRWRDYDWPQPATVGASRFTAQLPEGAVSTVAAIDGQARRRLLATAERLMDGHAEYFGITRHDMINPDWCHDWRTGRRAPGDLYAFDIRYRDEDAVGDIKQLWELSRHQHLTVLAAAYACTGEERYAFRVADHLKSWWAANPPLRGVHWLSGIELGIRLISWVWVRRMLDGWPGAPDLFEHNPEALRQIHAHQLWIATFTSHGSSGNNHAVAESAGLLAAACAFCWFAESDRWRAEALQSLDEHLRRNTFDSGLNRELATEYHGLVLELGLAAVAEAGQAVPESTWQVLARMTDALAAIVDERVYPPRQGDGDDGQGLVLDGEGTNRWASLLATGAALFGPLPWWPSTEQADVRTTLLAALIGPRRVNEVRPGRRTAHFADAGLTILRAGQIWCRLDGGPHGFLSIAAHAHADALSIELRHDGVDILADPGCYCYHGEPAWRAYFRSTLGHNTLELDGADQSRPGGPFLWTRHARGRVLVAHADPDGVSQWGADHDGYVVLHRRSVELQADELRIHDELFSQDDHAVKLAFHLGPTVAVELAGNQARLSWRQGAAVFELPPELSWSAHRGESDPPLGWYSPGFGRKLAATTLIGQGRISTRLDTRLRFGCGQL